MSVTTTYSVQGMTCGGCAKRVRTALDAEIPGLSAVEIDPGAGRVQITSEAVLSEALVQAAIEKSGYRYAGTSS